MSKLCSLFLISTLVVACGGSGGKKDREAPVINLVGSAEVTVEAGTEYTELGATAEDNRDGEVNVVIEGTVDTSQLGVQTILYSASDKRGNSSSITRKVIVADTTPPQVQLNGEARITQEVFSEFIDPGARAEDSFEGELVVERQGSVNTAQLGEQVLRYVASDSSGNSSEVTRTVNVVDTVGPVITLNGPSEQILEVFGTYVEQGATAFDRVNGEVSVRVEGTVNNAQLGSNTLRYIATDNSGNTTQITRSVVVVDTTAPTVTLNGSSSLTLDVFSEYVEQGATALDNFEGGLSVSITGEVNTARPGIYNLTYTAQDSSNNLGQVNRQVRVVDLVGPVIQLNGSPVVELEAVVDEYFEQGAIAIDALDGQVSVTTEGTVNTSRPGTYNIVYQAQDIAGNVSEISREVVVQDTLPPEITLNGEAGITLEVSALYEEQGATATDLVDGEVSVTIEGQVDTEALGVSVVTYRATDSAGNQSEITREVRVEDTTPPEITLNGEPQVFLEVYQVYEEQGATVIDNSGEEIVVTIEGEVDISTIGTYVVVYTAQDSSENSREIRREVIIQDTTPPEISLNGESRVYLEVFQVYEELGATVFDNSGEEIVAAVEGEVDISTIGTYVVVYTAQDSSENSREIRREVIIQDTTPPEISLNGESRVYLEVFQVYEELGATVFDNSGEEIVAAVEGEVDINTTGTYILVYTAQDSSENSQEIRREVIVQDTTPPEITLTGDTFITISAFSSYEEQGATAEDSYDGEIEVTIDGFVDEDVIGTYTITYYAIDNSGNESEVTRMVRVQDSSAPVVTLNGNTQVRVEVFSFYEELGANASDEVDGELSVTIEGAVNTDIIGSYVVTYSSEDSQGNRGEVRREVIVEDTTLPEITLNGESRILHELFVPYEDLGATAFDEYDGDLDVSIQNNVHIFTPGLQTVIYSARDSSGNYREIVREVVVQDRTEPVITLNGSSFIIVEKDADYQEFGATAYDEADGEIDIIIQGDVDTSTPGEYTVGYFAADSEGNRASISRRVLVAEQRPFVTQWQVDSNPSFISFNVPRGRTDGDLGFRKTYFVDWGDGITEEVTQENRRTVHHFYEQGGDYIVKIYGQLPGALFGNRIRCEGLVSIEQWGDIQWQDMTSMFYGCENVEINASDSPDLSEALSLEAMFKNVEQINADLSHWDVSQIRNMDSMFEGVETLNTDLNRWDVGEVVRMNNMFKDAVNFNGDISQWNVSSVNMMIGMFEGANNFNGDISHWNVSNVRYMHSLFNGAKSFNGDLSAWDVSRVRNMNSMFAFAERFNSDLSQWNVARVHDMRFMFRGAQNFSSDLSAWDIERVGRMSGMFWGAQAFDSDLSQWNVDSVYDMSFMFHGAKSFSSDLSAWDVSRVRNMKGMFASAETFNSDISSWDVSQVTNMSRMFYRAENFNSELNWDVSKVENMSSMFFRAVNFNSELNWDVSNVENMSSMFFGATRFNSDLSNWDVTNVKYFNGFLRESGMTTENYDRLLNSWSNLELEENIRFDAGELMHSSDSQTAKQFIIDNFGWDIVDGGLLSD